VLIVEELWSARSVAPVRKPTLERQCFAFFRPAVCLEWPGCDPEETPTMISALTIPRLASQCGSKGGKERGKKRDSPYATPWCSPSPPSRLPNPPLHQTGVHGGCLAMSDLFRDMGDAKFLSPIYRPRRARGAGDDAPNWTKD
jgi:hypothetical protein